MSGGDVLAVKNPVREHGASSREKAIHPRSEEGGILAFSRKVNTRLEVARNGGYGGIEN
jgi:hypothetical protein